MNHFFGQPVSRQVNRNPSPPTTSNQLSRVTWPCRPAGQAVYRSATWSQPLATTFSFDSVFTESSETHSHQQLPTSSFEPLGRVGRAGRAVYRATTWGQSSGTTFLNFCGRTLASFNNRSWRRRGSNPQPPACKAGALPIELRPLGGVAGLSHQSPAIPSLRRERKTDDRKPFSKWACVDSNHGPQLYQSCALTN